MKRDPKIDIARGLGIFTVVAGHLLSGFFPRFFYIFNMQFFFIISGFFHRPSENKLEFLRTKFFSLFIPYTIYLFLFSSQKLSQLSLDILHQPDWAHVVLLAKNILILIYGGALMKGVTGVFWFITCLFLTQQLFNFIVTGKGNVKRRLLVISGIFYLLATVNQFYFQQMTFPWTANVVLYAFPFYAFGFFYGDKLINNKKILLDLLSLALTVSAIWLVLEGHQIHSILKYADYGWFIYTPLAALGITRMMILLSAGLSKLGLFGKLLAYVGRTAITIMYVHQFIHFEIFSAWSRIHPWTTAIVITLISSGIHYLLNQTVFTRALLFGGPKDQRLLGDIVWRRQGKEISEVRRI